MSETKSTKVLVLRTCNADMSSHHTKNFIWPRSGPVEAPDWDPNPSEACGKGLHGLLWGRGDWDHLPKDLDAIWMVVEVDTTDGFVDYPGNKCRFRRGNVIYAGNKAEAITRVLCSPEAMEGRDKVSSGDRSTAASSGYRSTSASSGYVSKAASSGYMSTAASSGYMSTAASSGAGSMAASSGVESKAGSIGDLSKAEQFGKSGIAAAVGRITKAKAGENGLIIVTYWDEEAERYRGLVGEVGIGGIKPDTWYTARDGKLVETK